MDGISLADGIAAQQESQQDVLVQVIEQKSKRLYRLLSKRVRHNRVTELPVSIVNFFGKAPTKLYLGSCNFFF